jgi:hypothetical protein
LALLAVVNLFLIPATANSKRESDMLAAEYSDGLFPLFSFMKTVYCYHISELVNLNRHSKPPVNLSQAEFNGKSSFA